MSLGPFLCHGALRLVSETVVCPDRGLESRGGYFGTCSMSGDIRSQRDRQFTVESRKARSPVSLVVLVLALACDYRT